MKLYFEGKVYCGDECRVGSDWNPKTDEYKEGSILIGDRDFVGEILENFGGKKVTVAIADERFDGDVTGELGWGYSEYTPMDSDSLTVGKHDLIEILSRYEDKEIKVWVADEPINVLEDAQN